MEPMFVVQAQNHHVWFGQLLENGERWWTPLTPQAAADFYHQLGTVLERMSNAVEGQYYAGDLFTLEIGQAMEARNRVRSVEVGEG